MSWVVCVTGVLEQRKSLGPEPATADARRKSVIIVDKQPTDSPAASKCCSWFDHPMDVCTCQSAHFLPLLSIVAQICYKSLIQFHVPYHVLPFYAFPFLCAFMFLFLLGVLLGLPYLYFSFVEPACIMSWVLPVVTAGHLTERNSVRFPLCHAWFFTVMLLDLKYWWPYFWLSLNSVQVDFSCEYWEILSFWRYIYSWLVSILSELFSGLCILGFVEDPF